MAKRIEFIPPIKLPNGAELFTLEEAGRYIMAMPVRERMKSEWDLAGQQLVDAMHGRSSEPRARMAFLRALGSSESAKPSEVAGGGLKESIEDRVRRFHAFRKREPMSEP